MKPKRIHIDAKKAGITRVGCFETTLEMIWGGIELCLEKNGIPILPRELLRKFDAFEELFRDLAIAIATQKGGILDIRFSEAGRR